MDLSLAAAPAIFGKIAGLKCAEIDRLRGEDGTENRRMASKSVVESPLKEAELSVSSPA